MSTGKTAPETGWQPSELPPELWAVGRAVARLPRPSAPSDLAERTLARLEREAGAGAPAASRSLWRWCFQPITHPLARVAAVFLLAALAAHLANTDNAERAGRVLERVLGAHAAERLEVWVDRALLCLGPDFAAPDPKDAVKTYGSTVPPARQRPHGALPHSTPWA